MNDSRYARSRERWLLCVVVLTIVATFALGSLWRSAEADASDAAEDVRATEQELDDAVDERDAARREADTHIRQVELCRLQVNTLGEAVALLEQSIGRSVIAYEALRSNPDSLGHITAASDSDLLRDEARTLLETIDSEDEC